MGRGRRSAAQAVTLAAIAAGVLTGNAWTQQPAATAAAAPAPAEAAPGAAAQPAAAPLQGDARRGKARSYTCLGCHGIDGYRNAYPNYSVPKLKGQNPEYLAAALHGYRDGDRSHLTMHSQASTLTDQDILDIAAYFAGKPLNASGKPPGAVPKAATLCTTCHGQDGVAIAPMYPSLAGQHQDYLERALEEYRDGGRKNPVMKGFAATLSSADIDAITAYFSSLTPSLSTESRPYTRLTAGSAE
jgi:cytochrome c553